MTLTTLHTLSDEDETTVTLVVAQELSTMPSATSPTRQHDWDELPPEFQPMSLRETWRRLVHH